MVNVQVLLLQQQQIEAPDYAPDPKKPSYVNSYVI
jgi:hypothetical protein